MLLAGGHMLLKDAVLDLRKGRRYGVVFCPPTREGHQSHQSSWWVKRGLDPVLWEVSCASFFPGKLQKRDSDHFDLTHPENHPESLNPPKPNWFASDMFFFCQFEVGRNGAGKTTLMSTIAAGGVSGMTSEVKTLHVKPEAPERLSQMVWVERLLNPSCKKLTKWLFKMGCKQL